MRKYIFTAIIFILIFTVSQVTFAQTMSPNLAGNNNYLEGFNALNLDTNRLFLPSDNNLIEENKNFSLEGQEKLFDLASQFDRVENSEGFSFSPDLLNEEISLDRIITYNGEELKSISYSPDSQMNITADYSDDLEDLDSLVQTSFNLNYKLNSKTTVRAAYDLLGKTWENTNNLSSKDIDKNNSDSKKLNTEKSEDATNKDEVNKESETTNDDTTEVTNNEQNETNEEVTESTDIDKEKEEKTTNEDLTVDKEENNNQPLYNSMIDQQGSVGISYQTSDRISFSADYVKNNIFRETKGDSTIFGLEYVDEEGKLRARYEIIDGEERQETITGLELDLKNLASFSASYTLLNPQQIRDKLNKESVWDFGVDFNLSNETSFSIDYQLKDKSDSIDGDNFLDEKESNINASFKINF